MKPVTLLKYIHFGGTLSFLRTCPENAPAHAKGGINENINRVIQFVIDSEFKVTKNALHELKKVKEGLDKTPEDYKLNAEDRKELFMVMDRLLFVINAETKIHYSFSISEKRIDINKLLFKVGSLFAKDVYDSLPFPIKGDFKEGGECIAFELPTSAAFNILRGIEGLLRTLLKKIVPETDVSNLPWGPVIKSLRGLNDSNLSVLLDNCDRIRDNYRNPTIHPEKVYNIEEAQDLFMMCLGVVNDIITYMNNN
ncbi:hypothetical protein LCGC14_0718660 [marine sediment metagenome]|uniref:DUF4145 domain-containing protein n=1 Tax=marine sediment metagenome TaxID=412755 RepID=A0A0F9SYH6_9ZZZZ